ncbi:hypothetical protein PISMIDRAFT_89401 [Pisolithus microcarpus 441]|uniref:Uncharacterized protein n=1 Tax=Pisolithus microcarpus 441 TaxID=765257 RepID=A0A0C9YW34_9AGAM|nr:hypothetical protein PISMIDRAFT_89401 [Pisolithus microcarpus 441]
MVPDQPSQYLPFPPVHYGFNEVPQFDASQPPHPQSHPLFQGLSGPVPDFQFTSNDDLLRAIQDMDMSKIASAFKALGDVAVTADTPGESPSLSNLVPPDIPRRPVSVVDVPSTSSKLNLSTAPKSTKSSHKRVLDMNLPGPAPSNLEHAHMLANKWMNASKLAELVKTEGLPHHYPTDDRVFDREQRTCV